MCHIMNGITFVVVLNVGIRHLLRKLGQIFTNGKIHEQDSKLFCFNMLCEKVLLEQN